MRKIPMLGAVLGALAFAPAAAQAEVTSVFQDAPQPIACTTQAAGSPVAGQRWCGSTNGMTGTPTTVPVWDGTPIDTTVVLPPEPATGEDGNFPVVGIYHGYGGSKLSPTDANSVQRWVNQGYAVVSITDRGFWGSCGKLVPAPKPASCAQGYIHLMSNAYEVHDAQHVLGMLADDGVIDPQRIGATGGSYGGGMAMQLGALKDRVQQTDGTLVPWTSPEDGLPMRIAATAPEYGWSDLVQALVPNGSGLDYAAENPYSGPNGDHRFGVVKKIWNDALYAAPITPPNGGGYYAPAGTDPSANITQWYSVNGSGGPYDDDPIVAQQLAEFPNHGAYGTDSSVAPAPALISNGWNDDLFPVDEALRYYNKVRDQHPTTPISMVHLDLGHANRSASPPSTADATKVALAEIGWFAHYVKGQGPAPANAVGGVTAITSVCPIGSGGTSYTAEDWASLAPGEIRVDDAAAHTVAPDTAPTTAFSPANAGGTNPTVCTEGPSTNTRGAAVYETAAAPAGGFTLAGAATVLADLTVRAANDALVSRLYDVDPSTGTQRLIARGTYRPTGPGTTSRQVFQLHPQAYRIAEGHTVKLELLGRDFPYALNQVGQNPVGVKNLELRLPTVDDPGAAGGLVQSPKAKELPAGYTLAAGYTNGVPLPAAETPASSAPESPAPTPAAPVPAAPAAPAAPTAPAPKPAAKPTKDPISASATVRALRKAPTKVTLSRSLRSFRFTDRFPQAGRVSYRLGVRVGKRITVVGTVTRKVAKAGAITVTIRPTAKGRAFLRAHPKAALVLAARFTTAIEKQQYVSARVLKRR
jgi:predicted acyl esterase